MMHRLADAVADDPDAATGAGLVACFARAVVAEPIFARLLREQNVRVLARYCPVDFVIFRESQIVTPGRAVHAIHIHGAPDVGSGLGYPDLGLVSRALQY